MIFINTCKEVLYLNKFKKFNADIIFMDCFHNINVIVFKDGKKYKKEIIEDFNKCEMLSISDFNKYLKKYNLYCNCIKFPIRTLYYYKICDIAKNDTEKVEIKNNFNDLD